MSWSLFIDISIKGALLLAAAWIVTLALRRASAATRHLVWTTAMAGMLALPLLYVTLPLLNAPRPVVPVTLPVAMDIIVDSGTTEARGIEWRVWLVWLWAAGAVLFSIRLTVALVTLHRLIRRSQPLDDSQWLSLAEDVSAKLGLRRLVRLRASERVNMPVSCGLFRHTVLVPEQAWDWPEERRRIVLLHEIAHAARLDPLTQLAAQVACCLYWFNPLCWIAARHMAIERERACDDRVLACGAGATDYAGHLVEIARELRGRKPWLAAAIAMANRSQLEPRLLAILDRQLRRRGLTPRRVAVAIGLAALLVLPLAAMRPRAGNLGAVSGVIYDGVGVVPGAQVMLISRSSGTARRLSSDATGGYRFDSLEPGGYELRIRAPGFAEHRMDGVQVESGKEARRASYLRIGNIEERLDVVAERPAVRAPSPPRTRATPSRVRVGGNVQPAKLLKMVPPHYPEEVKEAGVEGFVWLRAIVLRDGTIGTLTVLDAPHPALAEAARQAVSKWIYQPVTLNGEPVAVETLINVRFRLTQ